MKETILSLIINVLRIVIQILYDILKIFPERNRVCFFSRQSDTLTTDFRMIIEEIERVSPDTETVAICHRFRDRRDGVIRFGADQLKSLWYLATSKACVLDAYWPAVCMLRHRKDLTVIQIWHSIGKIKRSGYQTLGLPSGRNRKLSEALRMHRNYTYIISGGEAWTESYCEAFDVGPETLRHYGLPRLDWLLSQPDTREDLEKKYPEIAGRTMILYVPTYRKYPVSFDRDLTELFGDEYVLVCHFHPNQSFDGNDGSELRKYDEEDAFTLLKACDVIITDYSSLALEAAALGKKTYYYLFDRSRYMEENGLNIDPALEMPGCAFENAADLIEAIKTKPYPEDELRNYQSKFLPEELGSSTEKIVDLIMEAIKVSE